MKITNLENLKSIQTVDIAIAKLAYSTASDPIYKNWQKAVIILKKLEESNEKNSNKLNETENEVLKIINELNDFYEKIKISMDDAKKCMSTESEEADVLIDNCNEIIEVLKGYEYDLKIKFENLSVARNNIRTFEAEKLKDSKNTEKIRLDIKKADLYNKYKQLEQNYNEEKKKLEEKLEQLKETSNKDDLILYNKVKTQVKKLPIIVRRNNDLCTGCNMEISPAVKSQLSKNGDCAICEECHRIIYYGD